MQLFGPDVNYFEQSLAQVELEGDDDKTLFLQLTKFELILVQYALYLLSRMYGGLAGRALQSKIHDVVVAQEFCDCPDCVAKREENDDTHD